MKATATHIQTQLLDFSILEQQQQQQKIQNQIMHNNDNNDNESDPFASLG